MSEDVERRADRARRLLDDGLLKESFDLIEADCIKEWKNTNFREQDKREKLWMQVKAIDVLKSKLQQAVTDGQLAKANRS